MEKTKKTTKKKSSDPWARSGERPGRGHGSELFVFFFFFLFFHGFLQFGQNLENTKKNKKNKKVQTHGQGLGYPHTNQKKKPKKQKTKKPKPKNQKTKKPKNQKKQKKQDCTDPKGRGSDAEWVLELFVFCCFFGFLVSWFFGFLVFGHSLENLQKKKLLFFFVFLRFGQTAKNQKTKKKKNQETKKPKNQKNKKNKKNKIAHPKGRGSDAECWVLSFCFFFCFFFFFLVFWFFGLDSHCRCAKQRLPGTVSGCTRSKVDTLQYSNVCYDIVHSANEQQRGMEFNFVRLRHMLLDLCTGNAAICALPQWPVLYSNVSVIPIIIWNNFITTSCHDLIGRSDCDELSPIGRKFFRYFLVSEFL